MATKAHLSGSMCLPQETTLLYLAAALQDPGAGQNHEVSQAPPTRGVIAMAPKAEIVLWGCPILHPHIHTPSAGVPMAPRPGLLAGWPVPRVTGRGKKMFGAPAAIQLPMVVFEELPYRPFGFPPIASTDEIKGK